MAYQFVEVSMLITSLEGSTGALGSLHFQVSDFVMDTTTGAIVVVPPINFEASGGFTGNPIQVPFLAMDDPSLSHNWAWILSAEVPGIVDFPKRRFVIDFANGAQQSFVSLAVASTIVT
jgi:hypothetical protein